MLTVTGVKLLDFGLAKFTEPEMTQDLTDAPTEKPLTSDGMIVGTLQYMSPEQLEGKKVDERTDIFALGVILYEMATQQRPFTGGSRTALAVSLLQHDPPAVSTLQPLSSPFLDRIIGTCLAKDPDERWQSAHDVRLQLEMVAGGTGETAPVDSAVRRSHRSCRWSPLSSSAHCLPQQAHSCCRASGRALHARRSTCRWSCLQNCRWR